MKGRPCLIESTDPLSAGHNYEALCGRWIQDAYFGASWDTQTMGPLVLKEENVCTNCLKALVLILANRPKDQAPKRRYLYGMLPSSEVKRGTED